MFVVKGPELIQLIMPPRWVPFPFEATWQSCKWYVQIRIHLWGKPSYRDACASLVSCQPCAKLGFRAATWRKGLCLVFSLFFLILGSTSSILHILEKQSKMWKNAFLLRWNGKIAYFRNSTGGVFCSILIMLRDVPEGLYVHSGVMNNQAWTQISLVIVAFQLKLYFRKTG